LTEGDKFTYTVELRTIPDDDVTVTITGTDGDTELTEALLTAANDAGGSTYITLSTVTRSFTSRNWNIPQDVTITADEDNDSYADHDGIELTHTAASDDDDYDEKDAEVEVDIADDDVDGADVDIYDAAEDGAETAVLAITEANTDGGSYWVELGAKPMSDVTVSITMGENDDNVDVSPLTLTFTETDWDERQKVTVTAPNDYVDEGDKTATLTHKATGGGYDEATLDANVVTVTVSDDAADVAAVLVTGLGGREVREGGSFDYQVELATQPTGTVSVLVSAGSVHNATFTFNADTWNQAQSRRITVPAGTYASGGAATTATVSVAGYTDGAGSSVTVAGQTFTVRDTEEAEVIVSETALRIAAGGSDTYTLSLTKAPAAGETVTITVASTGQIGFNPPKVVLNAGNWDSGMTVTLSPLAQATGTITVTNAAAASGGGDDAVYGSVAAGTDVTVTIPAS